ncbi:hypothetical protein [Stutzerimonas stutzeri]|jgi:hypothetical protein|uniref:DUF2591 domain-containing protein n=1 Tax=Stutzerimonas stutzeri TaxID=316 RepID=A0AA40V6J7_STUST|nr:hypothetical protein [Stutzerimonas stutzeri]MBA1265441.1 hypothetical protein [Stutzerimonas stutzeri]MBA1306130.1 hypothetical protein [Stutzerimonas stutzeri]MBS9726422.1 hypothetical protein [Stutzerimonas stutzeri]
MSFDKVAAGELSGRALDCAVALTQGWVWAKNCIDRERDDDLAQYRGNSTQRWAIGSLCLISEYQQAGLNATKPNEYGWLLPAGGEPVSLGVAHPDLPAFSTSRDLSGLLVEHFSISTVRCDDDWGEDAQGYCNNERIPVWCAVMGQHSICTSTEHQSHDAMYQIDASEALYGNTAAIAAMRCLVAAKLGKVIQIPQALVACAAPSALPYKETR